MFSRLALRALFTAMVICVGGGVAAFGQATDGNLVGLVSDPSGSGIVGATVEVTNTATNIKSTTMSGPAGDYRFNNLLVGSYNLTATKDGFNTTTLRAIDVKLAQTSTSNVSLQVGSASTVIEVKDTAVLIDTTTATVGNTFQVREAIDIPASSLALGVLNLSLLGAGVANAGGIGLGDGPSIGGQRPRNNSFTVEGVNDDRRDTTGRNIAVPNEAVAEFSLLQNQFSAEFGDATGGQFNTVVKGGGNQIHGSLYEYLQNRIFNAQDNLNVISGITSNPRFDQNTFGGSVGGPIKKDKLFYYGLLQYNPTGQAPGSSQGAVFSPTAAGYATLASIPGVSATNLGVLKQYLPAAPVGSRTTAVCPGIAAANCSSATPGAINVPIGLYSFASPSYLNILTYVASIDYNISETDQLRGRWIDDHHSGFDPTTLPELPNFFQSRTTTSKIFTVSEFHNFSPTLLNEFRLGYQRYNDTIPSGDYQYPGLDAFPNIVINSDLNVQLGPYQTSPQQTVYNMYQLIDNVSFTRGRHTFKFGWEGRKYIDGTVAVQRVRGDYEYSSLSQFVLDYTPDLLAERNVGVAPYSGNAIDISLYANDSFRFRPNLTLNVGLRWTYQGVPYGDSQWAMNSIASVPNLITFKSPNPQLTGFAPRIGLAYSPGTSGKTSIRLGFGQFYDKLFENFGTNDRPPEISTTVDAPVLGGNTPGYLAGGAIKASAAAGPSCTTAAQCRAITSGYIYDQQMPYALSWNAGIQHVFHNDYTLEVRYLGTKGVHLYTQDRINRQSIVTPTNNVAEFLTTPSLSVLAGLENLGTVQATGSNFVPAYAAAGFTSNITAFPAVGNSNYHGLANEFTKRFSNNLLFKAAYTWSHAIDDSTADLFSTLLSPRRPQDFQNLAAEKSSSFLDRRHRFTYTWVYDTPWFAKAQNKILRYTLGGYILSGTYTYESPQFATVQSNLDSNLNGDAAGDRSITNPNGVPNTGSGVRSIAADGSIVSTTTSCIAAGKAAAGAACTVAYVAINPNAQYIVAGSGAIATAGRQTAALRPINDWDIQIKKQFSYRERYKLQLAMQMFNLFNHPQYVSGYINDVQFHNSNSTNINLIPNSASFFDPTQVFSSNPRVTQFTARIEF